VLSVLGLVAVAAAAIAGGGSLALRVGLPLVVPSAVMVAGAAAVSTLRQPPDPTTLMMDSTGTRLLLHHAFPPALAGIGPAAVLLVRWQLGRDASADAAPLAASAALNVSIIAMLLLGWVRHRQGLAGYLAGAGTRDLGK
jgi:hypothetical protein